MLRRIGESDSSRPKLLLGWSVWRKEVTEEKIRKYAFISGVEGAKCERGELEGCRAGGKSGTAA